MKIDMRFSGGNLRDSVDRKRFEEILLQGLHRFRHRVKQVTLYLEDVNGPKGGIDKHCRCVLHLRRAQPIVVRDRDQCLTTLVYRVTGRSKNALRQKFNRKSRTPSIRRTQVLPAEAV